MAKMGRKRFNICEYLGGFGGGDGVFCADLGGFGGKIELFTP